MALRSLVMVGSLLPLSAFLAMSACSGKDTNGNGGSGGDGGHASAGSSPSGVGTSGPPDDATTCATATYRLPKSDSAVIRAFLKTQVFESAPPGWLERSASEG